MSITRLGFLVLCCSATGAVQSSSASTGSFAPQTTLPVAFTKTINANHVKTGDPVIARTLQTVRLADGREVKAGAQVLGHISEAQPFVFDKTPYAKQKQGVLAIQFDSLMAPQGDKIPLHVYLRAMADTFATNAAREPRPNDEDSLHSTMQVGGDILTPSQNEIINQDGDVVGYNTRGGAYAHLIANSAFGAARCDESNTEQAMAHFSASACGLYGFTGQNLASTALASDASTFSLTSNRRSPEVYRGSTALLEVVSTAMASVSR